MTASKDKVQGSDARRIVAMCLFLAAVTVSLYWPAGHFPFVAYDDPAYVADNAHVKSGLSLDNLTWAFSHLIVSNWHPVTTLSHMLDCDLFGVNPGAHHWVNVSLHAANVVLLFLLLVRLTGVFWPSAMVAALFALHPLHVESVAWIAERKDVLSNFFFMLTLLAYSRYVKTVADGAREARIPKPRGPGAWYWDACLLFALGLMSKPMLVTLPCVLLLLDFWPLRRFTQKDQRANLNLFFEKLPFVVLSLVFCVVTVLVQKSGGAMDVSVGISFADRLCNALTSYSAYLADLFWPTNLVPIRPHPALGHPFPSAWSAGQLIGAGVIFFALTAASVFWRRRRPWLAFGWWWYVATLVPVIGLIQVGEQSRADRYMYIPMIGLAIALVWEVAARLDQPGAVASAGQRPTHGRAAPVKPRRAPLAAATLAVATLIACAGVTRRQLKFWQSTTALFEHNVVVTPDNIPARSLLALGYEADGKINEAIAEYRVVAAADPKYHGHLGQLLASKKQWSEAGQHFAAAIDRFPNDAALQISLAEALQHLGKGGEAAEHLGHAAQLAPDSPDILNNLAWLRATASDPSVRDPAQAVQLAERACHLTQHEQTVLIGTLAAAYAAAGRYDEAIATAQQACNHAQQKGEAELFRRNQQLLQLYQQHQPFLQPASGN